MTKTARMTAKKTSWKEGTRKCRALELGNFQRLTIKYPRTIIMVERKVALVSWDKGKRFSTLGRASSKLTETAANGAAGMGNPVKCFFCAAISSAFPLASAFLTLKRTSLKMPQIEYSMHPSIA